MTMSLKMILLIDVPMFVICCAILWFYWNRCKKPKKKIFISADCWLSVFDLLAPSQLGHGIALISHRFDFYVDEHFKTRKWALASIQIGGKIGKNGTKQMEIVNFEERKALPIPQKPLPKKVVGFKAIMIRHINNSAIAFLGNFRPLFAACPINLTIDTSSDRILVFILHSIWPMFGKNMLGLELFVGFSHRLRKFVPSILNDCPSIRVLTIHITNLFIEFPCDDSAAASDGQALAKWLFTARPDNVPKMLRSAWHLDGVNLPSKIEDFKSAFASASSPANFIVIVWFCPSSFADFVLTNELTREQLKLKWTDNSHYFLLIRCPIARDESKWAKWEEEATIGWYSRHQWNQIDIEMNDEDNIGDGLLDATTSGPSDHQQVNE